LREREFIYGETTRLKAVLKLDRHQGYGVRRFTTSFHHPARFGEIISTTIKLNNSSRRPIQFERKIKIQHQSYQSKKPARSGLSN